MEIVIKRCMSLPKECPAVNRETGEQTVRQSRFLAKDCLPGNQSSANQRALQVHPKHLKHLRTQLAQAERIRLQFQIAGFDRSRNCGKGPFANRYRGSRLPDLREKVNVGSSDQRFVQLARGLDGLLVEVNQASVKVTILDGIKAILVQEEPMAQTTAARIKGMRSDGQNLRVLPAQIPQLIETHWVCEVFQPVN